MLTEINKLRKIYAPSSYNMCGQYHVHRRQTDRRTDRVKSIYSPKFHSGGYNKSLKFSRLGYLASNASDLNPLQVSLSLRESTGINNNKMTIVKLFIIRVLRINFKTV